MGTRIASPAGSTDRIGPRSTPGACATGRPVVPRPVLGT